LFIDPGWGKRNFSGAAKFDFSDITSIWRVMIPTETAMPSVPTPSIADTRQDQMFPTLNPSEIERVRRFGQLRTFAPGEALAKVGDRSGALSIVLFGEIEVTRHNLSGRPAPIVIHGPGAFLGELAQLVGRPALADAKAR
jgi:thioredoxin reductase (NADPH)